MATLADFTWFGCGEPVSEERIAAVQRRLGVRFPPMFLQCVRACDGGYPGSLVYKVAMPGFAEPWTYDIGLFRTFREPMPADLKARLLVEPLAAANMGITPWTSIEDGVFDPPEDFPPGLVPFADNGFGDLLCFDWRTGKDDPDPPIVIWLHEFIEDGPVVFLASNFDAFIASLERKEEKVSS